jgi:ornithine cyclodeaminase
VVQYSLFSVCTVLGISNFNHQFTVSHLIEYFLFHLAPTCTPIITPIYNSSMAELPRIYTLTEIEAAILSSKTFEVDLIQAVEDGFVAYSAHQFNAAPIQTMGAPPMAPYSVVAHSGGENNYAAQTCVKSGYITGDDHFVIKVATGGYPIVNTGLLQVYSQTTGKLECLLLDEGILTEHRTAAAGAVAARYLAPLTKVQTIGIVGTGVQARYQLRYLKHILPTSCRNVLVWGRTPERATQFQTDILREGYWQSVDIASDPAQLFTQCELIVTTTSARSPVLPWGTNMARDTVVTRHITCIGADAPGKMELDPALVAAADLLVADSRLQTAERGEYQTALAQNLVNIQDVVELGALPTRTDLHRLDNDDERLTLFDSSGVAVQDCAVAKLVSKLLVSAK